MKKATLISTLLGLTQFSFAQDSTTPQTLQKIEGCVYADIIYSVGERHLVQQSGTDPVTNKATMVDVKTKILQERVEDQNAEKTKSPRFYWRTL